MTNETPLSQRKIAEFIWPAQEKGAEENYEDRIGALLKHEVRRFYPVAHLAAAYQYAARYVEQQGRVMTFSYDNLAFHRAIVGFAGIFAGYIRKTPALAGAAGKLIEIEWRE